MTERQENDLIKNVRSLKKEIIELKEMINPNISKSDVFLNSTQTAKLLGVGRTKLFEMISNGELAFATKVGSRWRFSKNAILSYLGGVTTSKKK